MSERASIVGLGTVAATNDNAAVRTVQARLSERETRDQTAFMQHYGFSSRPHPGASTAHICLDGDRSKMVIVASHDQRYFFRLAVGEVSLHDDLGQSIHLTRAGIVINGSVGPTVINGDLRVTGDVIDRTATNTHNMASLRAIFDTHTHGGVQAGGAHTAVPDQTE